MRPEREIMEIDQGVDLPIETRPLPEPPKVTRLRRKAEARRRPPTLPPVVNALQLAREYQRTIATREVESRAELARRLGLSRARVTQVLYLMELAPEIQRWIDGLEPTSERPLITERCLRHIARRWPDPDDQLVEFERITGIALEQNSGGPAFALAQG